jgi:aminopeptidase
MDIIARSKLGEIMKDPRISNLAKILVNYSVEVQPGETVLLRGTVPALPLIKETYREIIHSGGFPLVILQDETFQEIFLREANDEQLQHVPEPMKLILKSYDCMINIRGAENTRLLSGVDPKRQSMVQSANRELMTLYMKRSAEGSFKWTTTLFPTAAHAQDADMSISDFEDFVYGACHADKPDPIGEWQAISAKQQRLVDWLAGKDKVVVKGPNIDMQLSIKDRSFINSNGKKNMPSGEIFTGPVEESVNGWVKFSYPAIVAGREVNGVKLIFEDGKVIQATAEKNEAFLLQMLETDAGAKFLGEFAIGTNEGIQQFTKSILYDEKIAGTIHMALGSGYPETGSKNVSAIHWDMICDMRDGGDIFIDDELFYRSGKFMI